MHDPLMMKLKTQKVAKYDMSGDQNKESAVSYAHHSRASHGTISRKESCTSTQI